MKDFILAHHTAIALAALHLAHLAWTRITRVYCYAAFNGGLYGVGRTLFFGRLKTQTIAAPAPQPKVSVS